MVIFINKLKHFSSFTSQRCWWWTQKSKSIISFFTVFANAWNPFFSFSISFCVCNTFLFGKLAVVVSILRFFYCFLFLVTSNGGIFWFFKLWIAHFFSGVKRIYTSHLRNFMKFSRSGMFFNRTKIDFIFGSRYLFCKICLISEHL